MATADRSAPFRRAGSLLALLGLELAAVLGLHWLGRFPGLRIAWDRPVQWLLSSPLQEVLGAILRMVGLVMAYWLLASTLIYLVASLSRLPAALRALRWVTLPVVRRVADHAVAVTLATSMVGGGTVALAGPAGAAPVRGGGPSLGPAARGPVAAATVTGAAARQAVRHAKAAAAGQPTSTTTAEQATTTTAEQATSTTAERLSQPRWRPRAADDAPELDEPAPGETTHTTEAGTTTTGATTTTEAGTTTTGATTTTEAATTSAASTTTGATTTTGAATTSAASTTTGATTTTVASTEASTTTGAATTTTAAAATTSTSQPAAEQGNASGQATTSTSQLRPPSYLFNAEEPTTAPPREEGGAGSGREEDQGGSQGAQPHLVKQGDNLWMIARARLAEVTGQPAAELSNREIAAYWVEVIEANRGRLRSGNPDLIYPDEEIVLPPVPGS
jgi:hypothetical protein